VKLGLETFQADRFFYVPNCHLLKIAVHQHFASWRSRKVFLLQQRCDEQLYGYRVKGIQHAKIDGGKLFEPAVGFTVHHRIEKGLERGSLHLCCRHHFGSHGAIDDELANKLIARIEFSQKIRQTVHVA
jgi:hypothetical protein